MTDAGETNHVLINESPRPRVLVRWWPPGDAGDSGSVGDELVRRLRDLVPTVRRIRSLNEVRQAEWDFLLTNESLQAGAEDSAEARLCVLYCQMPALAQTIERFHAGTVAYGSRRASQEILRIKGLPDHIADLVHEQLEPVVLSRDIHHVFRAIRGMTANGPALAPDVIVPFISTAEGAVLAGMYQRTATSECWLLPPDVPDIIPWVRAALTSWHGLAPDRFPGTPDWSTNPEWITQDEKRISAAIRDLDDRRRDILNELAREESGLKAELASATQAADLY